MGEATTVWTTKVHQHPERAVPQRDQEFLVAGKVAHVGFMQDGLPYVVPTLYHYSSEQPDRIYLHGGMSSRMLEELANGNSRLRHGHRTRWPGLFSRRQVSLGQLPMRNVLRSRPHL